VIRGICDTPERIPARIFIALGSEGSRACPCCSFWRGVVFGVALGVAGALAAGFFGG
jgi:hypothetical protein